MKNSETKRWRGRSYKRGGKRISALRERMMKAFVNKDSV